MYRYTYIGRPDRDMCSAVRGAKRDEGHTMKRHDTRQHNMQYNTSMIMTVTIHK